jgi:vancomycin resistance protein VanW
MSEIIASESPPRRIIVLDPDALPKDFELPSFLQNRAPRLSERFPLLYNAAVFSHCARRHWQWQTSGTRWANRISSEEFPTRIKGHKSLLLRTLGESEMWLQYNKVHNLKLIAPRMNRLLLAPGETFSFCKTIGNATKKRGFKMGMRLHDGKAIPGIGGGICQMANLLHWMVLHTPLTVTQRSTHSFDPFPDNGRVLPWGVGCSIAWNYVDLQFRNDTDATFQICVNVGEKYLEGEIRADRELAHSYKVFARGEEFLKWEDKWFRRNEIWRSVFDRETGVHLCDEKLKTNCALVRYAPV